MLGNFPYQDLEEHSEDLPLLDPSSLNTTVGSISISCHIEVTVLDYLSFFYQNSQSTVHVLILFLSIYSVQDPVETEQSFARRVLAIVVFF